MIGGYNLKLLGRQIGYGFVIVLGCLALAIFLTVNSVWLFDINIHPLNLASATGLTAAQMHHDYVRIIGYLQLPWIPSLKLDYFFSSTKGLQHFHDVKNLVLFNNAVGIVLVPLGGYLLHQLNKKSLTWLLITPIKVIITASLVIIALMFVNFEQVFIAFHEVLFRNQDWIFDPNTDPVINMLPDTFFLECFLLFFVLFFGAMAAIYWMGRRSLRKN